MNWTMPYPCRSRSDSVRRINMSSEPGNESFFFAFRPIPRILSLASEARGSQAEKPACKIGPLRFKARTDQVHVFGGEGQGARQHLVVLGIRPIRFQDSRV